MRKLLLTTTALAVTAGAAAADVTLSGAAEMGVAGSKDDSVRFHTDIQATLKMSGETDGGLTFGTAIDLSEVDGDGNAATGDDDDDGGITITLGGPFGTLTLGDTDGGFDWAMQEVGIGGSLRDDHEHGGYNGNGGLDGMHDGQILSYTNTVGAFGFAVSFELDDDTDGAPGKSDGGKGDTVLGLGTKYTMAMPDGGSVTVGLGYQKGATHGNVNGLGIDNAAVEFAAEQDQSTIIAMTDDNVTAVGGSVGFSSANGIQAILNYSRKDHEATGMTHVGAGGTATNARKDVEISHVGLGVGYTFGQTTIGANWGSMDTETRYDPNTEAGTNTDHRMLTEDTTGVGLSVTHDLGGGASLQFGVGSSETDTVFSGGTVGDTDTADAGEGTTKASQWSFGRAFSF